MARVTHMRNVQFFNKSQQSVPLVVLFLAAKILEGTLNNWDEKRLLKKPQNECDFHVFLCGFFLCFFLRLENFLFFAAIVVI